MEMTMNSMTVDGLSMCADRSASVLSETRYTTTIQPKIMLAAMMKSVAALVRTVSIIVSRMCPISNFKKTTPTRST